MSDSLEALRSKLVEVIATECDQAAVPGYVAGIAHGKERILLAHGISNVNTDAKMTADTAYLLGSVTKVMTTALLLRYVEQGHLSSMSHYQVYCRTSGYAIRTFRTESPCASSSITPTVSTQTCRWRRKQWGQAL